MASFFSSFDAYPVSAGNAIYAKWSFTSAFLNSSVYNTNFLYLLVTDASAVAAGNTISSVVVVPLRDDNNQLNTSFTVTSATPGMTFQIKNGTKYQFMAQLVYTNTATNVTGFSNSAQSIVTCSTVPSVPNFAVAALTDSFQITLLNADGSIPTPISAFDGYGELKGVFVTFSSATQLYSVFIANDASNNVYTDPLVVDVPFLDVYEVSVSSYNYTTTDNSANPVSWGGRSQTSPSKLVSVFDTPGAVTGLSVYETMRDVSAVLQPTYSYVSNTLSWSPPINGGETAPVISYLIYRNNVLINTYTTLSAGVMTYIDNVGMTAGTLYTYSVSATNSNGEGPKTNTSAFPGVVFPVITSFTADPSGSQILSLRTTVATNGFPLASYLYDYSYNSVQGSRTQLNKTSPYTLDASNGVLYTLQSRTKVPSISNPAVIYTTTFSLPPIQSIPYNPLLSNAIDISANPLDASGNPSGVALMSWTNPSNTPGLTGQQTYQLFRKPTVNSDASYSLVDSAQVLPLSRVSYTDASVTLGTSYTYKIVNIFTSGTIVISSSGAVSNAIISFVVPTAVQNLALISPTITDMSYSYIAPSSLGGYALSAYYCTVNNVSDGSSVAIVTNINNGSNIRGLLSSITGGPLVQGNKYELIVRAAVFGNTNVSGQSQLFYGPTSTVTNFTVPQGVNSPSVDIGNSTTLYNGIKIDWSTAPSYTALDASNAVFNIHKNGNPVPLFSAVTGTSYLDTTELVGTTCFYQVRAVVNGVSAAFTPGTIPTPSSSITNIKLPAQVTGSISVVSKTFSSVLFSWNASSNGSGVSDNNLRYFYTLTNNSTSNIDASGVTAVTSANITSGLVGGGNYTIAITSGILSASGVIYYNTTRVTGQVALSSSAPNASYDPIYGPSIFAASSSGALLTNVTNYTDVSGLTFVAYRQQLSTDPGFNGNQAPTTSSTSSEFYAANLINGTTYFLRCAYVYTNSLQQTIVGGYSSTISGVPAVSPNQPTGLAANTTTSTGSIKFYWNVPTTGIIPNAYSVQCGTNSGSAINDLSFNPLTSFGSEIVDGVTKFFKTITGLTTGVTYYLNVIGAVNFNNGSISVSQPSSTITAVPYGQPSAVRSLTADPNPSTIDLDWLTPSVLGGAGQGSNGILMYQAQISTDASFINIIQDISGIQQLSYTFTDLSYQTVYNVRVLAYFNVQSVGFYSYGPYSTITGISTRNQPVDPILNYTSINQAGTGSSQQAGKYVSVSWSRDPLFTGSYILQRQISTSDDVSLNDFSTIATGSYALNDTSVNYIDRGAQSTGSTFVNFLNGNKMTYRLLTTYTGYPQQTINTTQSSSFVIPFSDPIATDSSGNPIDLSNVIVPQNIDGSGNFSSFVFRINKNGGPILSITAVGISADEQNVPVISQANPNITFANTQTNATQVGGVNVGGIAKNQYAEYVLTFKNQLNAEIKVNNVLAIESNAAGTLITKYPYSGGKF